MDKLQNPDFADQAPETPEEKENTLPLSSLELYCSENPEALECRIYDV
jgi:hypothetical protein